MMLYDGKGNVIQSTAQVTDEQVSSAVNNWMQENPEATTFLSYDKAKIEAIAEPLPKIGTGYYFAQTSSFTDLETGTTKYYSTVYRSKTGSFVKLTAGVKYLLAMINKGLHVYPEIPTYRELSETESAQITAAGYDPGDYLIINYNGTYYGLYQLLAAPFEVTEGGYLFVEDSDEVFEWNEALGLPATYLDDNGSYHYFQNNTLWRYTNPFGYETTQHHRYNKSGQILERHEVNRYARRLFRQSRILQDMRKSAFTVCFIGDSITYAASNAGLQRAFRKQVPYKLECNSTSICVSGTCMTNGYGMAWTSGDTGLTGLLAEHTMLMTAENDLLKYPSVFVIGLGTNDFGNDAPLGNVEDDDRSTTFAGCYLALIEQINTLYPNSGIICMCPFNRNNYDTANNAGHKLIDYSRVIHEIVSFMPNTWVLDLSNSPILNYANYPAAYVDGVHIGKYGHAVVANELHKIILQIVAVMGFDYMALPDFT